MTNRIPPSALKPTTSSTPAETASPSPTGAPADPAATADTGAPADPAPATTTSATPPPPSSSAGDGWGTAAPPPSPSTTGLRYQGLPEVLLDHPVARVVHGDDPGDYYCEHMFFESQRAATASGTVARNRLGEPLVGFLHIPRDEHVRQPPEMASYAQETRHAGTREVVGAALGGFLLEARSAVSGPVRIMLNGYDRFRDVCNNPTGEFVVEDDNLDAALALAFGGDNVRREDVLPVDDGEPEGVAFRRYTLGAMGGRRARALLVRTQRFPVTDAAIDGRSATSVQQAMARFAPHVVLSLGVCGPGPYLAEHNAGDGGLLMRDAGHTHVHDRPATCALPPNFALARAILAGAEAAQHRASTV